MGFTAELVLLYPLDDSIPEQNAWVGHEPISFGRVTRLEKLTAERFRHIEFSGHKRAACCTVSLFFSKLWPQFNPLSENIFAPEIVSDYDEVIERDERNNFIHLATYLESTKRGFPSNTFGNHNAITRLPRPEIEKRIQEEWHPVLEPPIMWQDCIILAQWLSEAEEQVSEEWKMAQVDPVSIALMRAWRAYFLEVSKVRAKALFLFPTY